MGPSGRLDRDPRLHSFDGWPAALAPERFRERASTFADELGVELVDVDCSRPPCVARYAGSYDPRVRELAGAWFGAEVAVARGSESFALVGLDGTWERPARGDVVRVRASPEPCPWTAVRAAVTRDLGLEAPTWELALASAVEKCHAAGEFEARPPWRVMATFSGGWQVDAPADGWRCVEANAGPPWPPDGTRAAVVVPR